MTKRLAKVGLTPIFFEAVDGYQLDIPNLADYDGEKRRRYFGKDLKAGEIGCLLSHRAIYEKMVTDKIPCALILEDDVFLADNFKDVIEDLQGCSVPWDLIRFVGHGKVFDIGYRSLASLRHGYDITRVPTSPSGAYAYLLTQEAAKRLLHFMHRNWIPVDIIHSRAWQTCLETLLIHPSPVTPDLEGPSTIGDARFDNSKQIRGLTKLLHPFCRFWYKLSNGAGKRIVYFLSWFRDRKYLSN